MVTAPEMKLFRAVAQSAGIGLSTWIRDALFSAANNTSAVYVTLPPKHDPAYVYYHVRDRLGRPRYVKAAGARCGVGKHRPTTR